MITCNFPGQCNGEAWQAEQVRRGAFAAFGKSPVARAANRAWHVPPMANDRYPSPWPCKQMSSPWAGCRCSAQVSRAAEAALHGRAGNDSHRARVGGWWPGCWQRRGGQAVTPHHLPAAPLPSILPQSPHCCPAPRRSFQPPRPGGSLCCAAGRDEVMTGFVFRPVSGRYYQQTQENGAKLPSFQFKARAEEGPGAPPGGAAVGGGRQGLPISWEDGWGWEGQWAA